MLFARIKAFPASNLLWYLLYIGYVTVYMIFMNRSEECRINFSQSLFAGFAPLVLLVFSMVVEYAFPYRKDWLKFDMNTLNNILFMVINNYGDVIGKTLGLLLVLEVRKIIPVHTISGFWPQTWPIVLQVILGLLLYDFVYYWYHRVSHHTSLLWKLHRLHHSTERMTTIAVFKFNMLDIIIELFLLTVILKLTGVPDRVYLIMVGFMVPATTLSHANFTANIPDWLGWLIINSDNHRIHHSNESTYYNRNFGGFTLFWDVVFRTYQPTHSIEVKEVGLKDHRTSKWIWDQFFDFLKR